jgi:hypothetical protein
MTTDDEKELKRLSDMLAFIDSKIPKGVGLREGLKKAGLALALGFINGSREEIERLYEGVDKPASPE